MDLGILSGGKNRVLTAGVETATITSDVEKEHQGEDILLGSMVPVHIFAFNRGPIQLIAEVIGKHERVLNRNQRLIHG